MLEGVERLVDLTGTRTSVLLGAEPAEIEAAVHGCDVSHLERTDGHFACVQRDCKTVRLARTTGLPLRYFVAKMFHGPFLVVADRIDTLFDWCRTQKIGWQFDPAYTRMVPANYLAEIEQIGCPDPAPRYSRFFNPEIGRGPADIDELGAAYIGALDRAIRAYLASIPANAPVAVAFSGGIDSTSVLILADRALREMNLDPSRLRAFTLDLGNGPDAQQAETVATELGLRDRWEAIRADPADYDLEAAIGVIEDYHPLDVQCAAASICLLRGIRERYPEIRHLLDGDGGDENLMSYPMEDSDLTLSSVLRNPLLYLEGWGLDAIKHSQTYSGGLSRSYVRTYAPARKFGFDAFSPYTMRSVVAEALRVPMEALIAGDPVRLYGLKGEIVRAGVRAVAGVEMPVHAKRRFQDGIADESHRRWKVGKAWCRNVFLKQWESRLREAWDETGERVSGNDLAAVLRS